MNHKPPPRTRGGGTFEFVLPRHVCKTAVLERVATNPEKSSPASGSETSAPETLEQIVRQAEQANASDIHFQMQQGRASVSFRLDGVMTSASELPAELA